MALLFDQGPTMSRAEFRLLRDMVESHCGLNFEEDTQFVMERKLRSRLEALGLDDFSTYYELLRENPAEMDQAVEVLTTNETYFFREYYQLEAFAKQVVPRIMEANAASKRIAVWSAGCSTGEEVYTVAMLLASNPTLREWDVRVFGSDISRRVVQHARRGIYGTSSFRAMPRVYSKYFREVSGGREVLPEIRARCHFGRLNLLDGDRSAIVGSVDAIFCRNVLIYFDQEARRRVIRTLYDRLVPGGYLMLGHSESLLRSATEFELVHLEGDLVYRRPHSAPDLMQREPR